MNSIGGFTVLWWENSRSVEDHLMEMDLLFGWGDLPWDGYTLEQAWADKEGMGINRK